MSVRFKHWKHKLELRHQNNNFTEYYKEMQTTKEQIGVISTLMCSEGQKPNAPFFYWKQGGEAVRGIFRATAIEDFAIF